MHRVGCCAPLVLALTLSGSSGAVSHTTEGTPPQRVVAPHTTVEVIADHEAVSPGASLWVGVRFVLEAGWHIYWLNPGDSGSAPTFDWHLPAGFSAGATEWPVPERLAEASLVNYGYRGGVVFPTEIRSAGGFKAAGTVAIGVHVTWLVCREICVTGHANLELSLPVRLSNAPSSSEGATLVAESRARVPREAPSNWRATARSDGDVFVLSIDTGAPVRGGVFFPLEVSQIDDAAPQRVTSFERGLRFTLRKSDQLMALPAALTGVVQLLGGRAYVIRAPLASATIR